MSLWRCRVLKRGYNEQQTWELDERPDEVEETTFQFEFGERDDVF